MSIKHVTALLDNCTRIYGWQAPGSSVICTRTLVTTGEWENVEVYQRPEWWIGEWSPESLISWWHGIAVMGAPTTVRGLTKAAPGRWQPEPDAMVDYCFPYFRMEGRHNVIMQMCTCWEGRHGLRTFRTVESAVGSLTPGQIGRMTTDPAVNEYSRAAAVSYARLMGWGKAA